MGLADPVEADADVIIADCRDVIDVVLCDHRAVGG